MNIPQVSVYGNYNGNYGVHSLCFEVPCGKDTMTLYFSYKTLVAFSKNGVRVVHENDWGPTTGKHLNAIDDGDKKSRVSDEEFKRLYAEATGQKKPEKPKRVRVPKPAPLEVSEIIVTDTEEAYLRIRREESLASAAL